MLAREEIHINTGTFEYTSVFESLYGSLDNTGDSNTCDSFTLHKTNRLYQKPVCKRERTGCVFLRQAAIMLAGCCCGGKVFLYRKGWI